MTVAQTIANYLLDIEAVKLRPNEPFTWASGWKSPIYCDNRITLGYPDIRQSITLGLCDYIRNQCSDVNAIVGVATAGIPQACWVADALHLPLAYVRSSPKKHGMGNLIEGLLEKGQKVVVIEDLISTGGSSMKSIEALRDAGCEVLGLASIFNYGFQAAQDLFTENRVKHFSLTNYEILIKVVLDRKEINEKELASLQAWRENPATWKPALQ